MKLDRILKLLNQLDTLHETRKTMSYFSNYHGVYEDECINLNKELFQLSGYNYVEFSWDMKKLLKNLLEKIEEKK